MSKSPSPGRAVLTTGRPRALAAASERCQSVTQYTQNPSTAAFCTALAAACSSSADSGISSNPVSSCSAASASPRRNCSAYGSVKAYERVSVKSTPTAPIRPRRNDRAVGSGPEYPKRRAAAKIFSRNSGESWSGRLYALDTVLRDTPTVSATVCRVGLIARLLYRSRSLLNRYSTPTGEGADPVRGSGGGDLSHRCGSTRSTLDT